MPNAPIGYIITKEKRNRNQRKWMDTHKESYRIYINNYRRKEYYWNRIKLEFRNILIDLIEQ